MEITLDAENLSKPGVKGYTYFLYFLTSIGLSQFLFDYSWVTSIIFLVISFFIIGLAVLTLPKIDLLFFMFFTVLMNILIPVAADRTFSQIIPLLFFVVIFIKSPAVRTGKITLITVSLFFYFIMVLVAVFNDMKLPSFSGEHSSNTGFLARFNLLNTFFVFMATLLSFKPESLPILLNKLYKLFLVILIISLIIFFFDVRYKLPFFNTFSWSIIYEAEGSKRMGIAGVAATYVLVYLICFRKQTFLLIFPLVVLGVIASGGRAAFLAFLLVIYLHWVVKHRILIKSFLISCGVISAFIAFSLSPLILHVPQDLQRVFIIFPKEFYPESLQILQTSSAANSSTFRYEMWKKAAPEIKENPIVGKGFDIPMATYSFSSGMEAFTSKSIDILYHDFMAAGQLHNTYVSIAYIMGVPAAIFFLYAFLASIYKTYQRYLTFSASSEGAYLEFLLLILFTSFLSSLFGDIYFDLTFFIFLAITLKTINGLNSKTPADDSSN